jgi:hypothetical protein
LPRHTLNLSLLLTLILLLIGPLPYILHLLTTLLLLITLLLLFIVESLKSDSTISEFRCTHLNMVSRLLLLKELPRKSDLLALLALATTCFSLQFILLNKRIYVSLRII